MAKEAIPFELFRKWYYPESNPPIAHVDRHYIESHLEKFVGEIYNVTVDDLLSLSEEELLLIPTDWLYQWTWCHGNSENSLSPGDFFQSVEAKREEYKTIDIALLRAVQDFLKAHNQFTAGAMQQALGISYNAFLGVLYWLVSGGKVQCRDKQYFVVG